MTSGLNYPAPTPPPEPDPEGTVLFDDTVVGTGSGATWTLGSAANVGDGFYRQNAGEVGSTNPGPQLHTGSEAMFVLSSSGFSVPNWSGDACASGAGGTVNSRRIGWGLIDGYFGLVHLMDAGDGNLGEAGWTLRIAGHVRHPRATGAGSYSRLHLDAEFFANTNTGSKSQSNVRLVADMFRGEDREFDETIALDAGTQSFALLSVAPFGTDHRIIWESLYVELFPPAGS